MTPDTDSDAARRDATIAENHALRQRVAELEYVVIGLMRMIDDTRDDSEGRYPIADAHCLDCTLGTTPVSFGQKACAYHAGKALLARCT